MADLRPKAPTHPSDCKTPWTPERGPWLSPFELALYLGITERQMRRLADKKLIPYHRVGPRMKRFHIDDVNAYIESQRVT